MARKKAEEQFFNCSNCGEEVRMSAKACPYCGADDEAGWSGSKYSNAYSDDSEEDDFDYDEFVRTQIHGKKPRLRLPSWIWVVAVIMLLVFVWGVLKSFHLF